MKPINGWVTNVHGSRLHYVNGKLHNENGPAFYCYNGSESYYINDELHRVDGPAYIDPQGFVQYYLRGFRVPSKVITELKNSNADEDTLEGYIDIILEELQNDS